MTSDDDEVATTGGGSRWDTTDAYWFRKNFHTEVPGDLSIVAQAEDLVGKAVDPSQSQLRTPCSEGDPDRFFPEVDDRTDRKRFKRRLLADLAAECAGCPFRIGCAITALETDATAGVWAGVLVRDYSGAETWHRRQLLAVLAKFAVGYLMADPEAITPAEEKLYARLEVLLQRQDRLRPVFAKEFAQQQRQLLFAAAEPESDSETSAAESVPVPSRSAVRVGKPRPFIEVVPGDQLELQFAVSA
ncbi:transcriptional regulator WhiB [Mycolicibacterium fortuitum subsp. acetamidolyticum]|uniref:Transcriptional regulator WhiB n=1 Tax=Mycolicibacterium fortuitum subsp. acetamidolyticum TaxID=144550 RepID=A0A100WMG3_MYCFO|nr:transcriptional regulator WhiB [Mycolicibacterium fortuitum subsp. acetamidolyticum]